MIKFLLIAALAVVGFPAGASAQTSRFDQVVEACKYRGAILRNRIATGQMSRAEIDQDFDQMTAERFRQLLVDCRRTDKRFVEPRAPANTRMESPSGPPQQIVPRPQGAPMSEYYRCNAQTKLPDANGTKICGPVRQSDRKQ